MPYRCVILRLHFFDACDVRILLDIIKKPMSHFETWVLNADLNF